ncbi:hypothetical protein [Hymenobacter cavernae]|uniref:Uncharacterized protein n=1 Tax=Hymenobacter cavernae TaxID=2044852 RepID=A0ABQ1UDK3_9BACT|nr:hypothetical protein [Hymenobacter cavernae]GGF15459.1 hypothetical protein GCM10011383_28450 [Hymenobacter cavernae]
MNATTNCHLLVECEKVTPHDVTVTVTNPYSRAVWRIDGVRRVWAQMGAERVASFIVERYIYDHYPLRDQINFKGLQSAITRILPLPSSCSYEELV